MRAHRTRAVLLVLGFGLLNFAPARAEVGVVVPVGTSVPAGAYVVGVITEEPTPIGGSLWVRMGPPTVYRSVLNPGGETNEDGAPSLVSDSAGLIVAGWSLNTPTGYDVVVSRFVAGDWTAPQVVIGGSGNQLDPKLALAPNGSVHLLYWVDSEPPQVFYVTA